MVWVTFVWSTFTSNQFCSRTPGQTRWRGLLRYETSGKVNLFVICVTLIAGCQWYLSSILNTWMKATDLIWNTTKQWEQVAPIGEFWLFAVILHHLECMNPVAGNTLYFFILARIFFHQQHNITSLVSAYIISVKVTTRSPSMFSSAGDFCTLDYSKWEKPAGFHDCITMFELAWTF